MKKIQLYFTPEFFGIRYRPDDLNVYQCRTTREAAKNIGYVRVARWFMATVRAMARADKMAPELIAKDTAAKLAASVPVKPKRKNKARHWDTQGHLV